MAQSTQRVLKRQGRIRLIEATNPVMGVVYSVSNRNLRLWTGSDLSEAEQQFGDAAAADGRAG